MKTPIIILHGWVSGNKGRRYDALKDEFKKIGYDVYLPDLPGFGTSKVDKPLTFDDYIVFLKKFIEQVLQQTKAKKVILIGHSFGGRIAITYTSQYGQSVEKLILTGASGISHRLSPKKKIISTAAKVIKPIFTIPPFSFAYSFVRKGLYLLVGEMDYYKAGNMTETFKNVYQVSIIDDLKKITVPTLLLWGDQDTIIPIADGEYMQHEIKNSKLVIIPEATHKLPYEKPELFVKEVVEFIK